MSEVSYYPNPAEVVIARDVVAILPETFSQSPIIRSTGRKRSVVNPGSLQENLLDPESGIAIVIDGGGPDDFMIYDPQMNRWYDKSFLDSVYNKADAPRDSHARVQAPKLGRGVVVYSGAVLSPRVRLEDNIMIAPDAKVVGQSIVGSGTWIGQGAQVKGHSIIGSNGRINDGAVVVDVSLGKSVHIGCESRIKGARFEDFASTGEGVRVGRGTRVVSGKRIGNWCDIGSKAYIGASLAGMNAVGDGASVEIELKRGETVQPGDQLMQVMPDARLRSRNTGLNVDEILKTVEFADRQRRLDSARTQESGRFQRSYEW